MVLSIGQLRDLCGVEPAPLQQLQPIQHVQRAVFCREKIMTGAVHNVEKMGQLVDEKPVKVCVRKRVLADISHSAVVGMLLDWGDVEHQLQERQPTMAIF